MTHRIHDVGVAARIGKYGDAIEVAPNQRWLFTSGTPGMDEKGEFPPDITRPGGIGLGPYPQDAQSARTCRSPIWSRSLNI